MQFGRLQVARPRSEWVNHVAWVGQNPEFLKLCCYAVVFYGRHTWNHQILNPPEISKTQRCICSYFNGGIVFGTRLADLFDDIFFCSGVFKESSEESCCFIVGFQRNISVQTFISLLNGVIMRYRNGWIRNVHGRGVIQRHRWWRWSCENKKPWG